MRDVGSAIREPSIQGARPTLPGVEIRELPSIEFWAGKVTFPRGVSLDQANQDITDFVQRTPGSSFAGFLTRDVERVEYEFTRYPRRQFGEPPTIEELERRLPQLAEAVGGTSTKVLLPSTSTARIVLGLSDRYYEHQRQVLLQHIDSLSEQEAKVKVAQLLNDAGQHTAADALLQEETELGKAKQVLQTTELAVSHSLVEVGKKISSDVAMRPAVILSVYEDQDHGTRVVRHYEEPAVVLQTWLENQWEIVALGHLFHQSRIAIERSGPNGSAAAMIEYPQWCKDPDSVAPQLETNKGATDLSF